jgi:putative ABC transport system permease protein
MAQTLYQQNVPLGQTLEILGQEFIVTGIFSDFQSVPFSGDIDFNNAVFISNQQAVAVTKDHAQIYEMLVRPDKLQETDLVVDRLNGSLLAAHGGQQDFTVVKQSQTILVANNILHLLTTLIAGVAAIALLVGGVGIMNVMLVSVTERMHEIGIRKAIGATNLQILRQFIIEAAVLSVSGAVGGIALSYAIAITLRLFTDLQPVISWQVAVGACIIAIGVGILFGAAPAFKAARKEPIGALRNE